MQGPTVSDGQAGTINPTRVDVTFSHSQSSLGTRLINGGRKFSEISVIIR